MGIQTLHSPMTCRFGRRRAQHDPAAALMLIYRIFVTS
jgi:hypothetical protein